MSVSRLYKILLTSIYTKGQQLLLLSILYPYSDNVFIEPNHVKVQTGTHTQRKQYVCSQCNKAFSMYTKLKMHQIIHTEEKSFCWFRG